MVAAIIAMLTRALTQEQAVYMQLAFIIMLQLTFYYLYSKDD